MKPGFASFAICALALALALGACGKGGSRAGHTSHQPTATAAVAGSPNVARAAPPPIGRFKGDEDDDDEPGESRNPQNHFDKDVDFDNDVKDRRHKGYYDNDDAFFRTYGHPADAADRQAMTALVKRYYKAAAAADGAAGCALTYSTRANSLPEDYGPSYMPGAKTCAAVLTVVFRQLHRETAQPVVVTVRVDGNRADVLLGWHKLPAGVIQTEREHGVWKVDNVLATHLR